MSWLRLGKGLVPRRGRRERAGAAVPPAEAGDPHFGAESLRQVIDHMPEGVSVTDAGGRVLLVNPAFREILRRAPDTEALLAELTAAALEGRAGEPGELSLGPPEPRHLTLLASPLPAGRGAVVVAKDVTESVRLAESRRDLVANVSHELKTPLTAIRGYAETLEDGALAKVETARHFTAQILGQCRRLEALLGDLLTLSKMESRPASGESAGSAESLATVDLGRLMREVGEVLASLAAAKDISLVFDLEEPSPRIRGDAAELERMLLNLLENAIKYNRGGAEVRLRLRAAGDRATIEIQDRGIGIPPEARERIFERFYRVDKGRARDEGGTGLGLAIVKHAARRHGGTVEVESTLGQGSTFRVRLPLAPP